MANENEIIPVLSGDESEDEMLEMEDADDAGRGTRGLEQQLTNFRQQWQRELEKGSQAVPGGKGPGQPKVGAAKRGVSQRAPSSHDGGSAPINQTSEEEDDIPILSETTEEKAKYLFRQGVRNERNGNMYEAVMFYKQAMHLVPDVEYRVQESEGNSHTGSNQVSDDEENNNEVEKITIEDSANRVDDDMDMLTGKLQSLTTNDLRKTCKPRTPQTAPHISVLPMEVLVYILRWVVSKNLDLRSLEQVSQVCKGFYVCSRDGELWRRACIRMWGKAAYLMKDYSSWRQMYVDRPHPHFNGIYISRVTYIRQGEPSIDAFYKPWHVVEYHRYLRVFPDGTILLVTSADEPQSIVTKMNKNSPISGKMMGRYQLMDDTLVASLEKEKVKEMDGGRRYMRHRQAQPQPDAEKTFHLELRMSPYLHKPNLKLEWRNYSCHTRYRSTGNEQVTEFDITHQFNSFYFYRVKSYTKSSETPL